MSINAETLFPVAISNGKIIHANNYTNGSLKCLGCNQSMYFRRTHKRKLNNKECNVRCTFVHKNESICESYNHKTAKKIISSTISLWKFITEQCRNCGKKQRLEFPPFYTTAEETPFYGYRLDVGVFDQKQIVGAVEIYNTHHVDECKKQKLDSLIKWVEVDASTVIQAFQCKKYIIESNNKVYKKCASCVQNDLDKISEEKERQQMSNEDLRTKERINESKERVLMQEEERRTEEYNGIIYRRKRSKTVLTFGKYKGMCVDELFGCFDYFDTKDWWYLIYLAGYARSKFYKNHFPIPKIIRDTVQEELKNKCILCEEDILEDWKLLCTSCWRENKNSCLRCDRYIKGTYTFCWDCNKKIK